MKKKGITRLRPDDGGKKMGITTPGPDGGVTSLPIILGYVPVDLKLQPPGAYHEHLTVHIARGGGNLNVPLEGWRILNAFVSCSSVICLLVFWGGLQCLTDLQDKISPFFSEKLCQEVFKRRLKVSLRHISLWEA